MSFSIVKNIDGLFSLDAFVYMADKSANHLNSVLRLISFPNSKIDLLLKKLQDNSLPESFPLQGDTFRNLIASLLPSVDLASDTGRKTIKTSIFSTLNYAIKNGSRSIVLYIDSPAISNPEEKYKIVIQTIKSFLKTHRMNIYLYITSLYNGLLTRSAKKELSSWILDSLLPVRFRPVESDYQLSAAEPSLKRMEYYEASSKLTKDSDSNLERRQNSVSYKIRRQVLPDAYAELSLEETILDTDTSFSETLMSLIRSKGLKDSSVYNKANIDRRHFSKIRTGEIKVPKKQTVLALAIALELDILGTNNLLEKAGYSLSRSILCDVIVRYYIEKKNYDIFEINCALFDYDQPLLGSLSE